MDSPGEILRLCRLCLVKDQVNIPIFEADGDSREIFLKISSCLPVKVSGVGRHFYSLVFFFEAWFSTFPIPLVTFSMFTNVNVSYNYKFLLLFCFLNEVGL